MPRPLRRTTDPFSAKAQPNKNATNQLKKQPNRAEAVNNTIGMKPSNVGYSKIKGAVSG